MVGYIHSAFVVWTCDTFENNLEITNSHGICLYGSCQFMFFDFCYCFNFFL